jgi:hypothetical protein
MAQRSDERSQPGFKRRSITTTKHGSLDNALLKRCTTRILGSQRTPQHHRLGESPFLLQLHVLVQRIEAVLQRTPVADRNERIDFWTETAPLLPTGADGGMQVVEAMAVRMRHAAALMAPRGPTR